MEDAAGTVILNTTLYPAVRDLFPTSENRKSVRRLWLRGVVITSMTSVTRRH